MSMQSHHYLPQQEGVGGISAIIKLIRKMVEQGLLEVTLVEILGKLPATV